MLLGLRRRSIHGPQLKQVNLGGLRAALLKFDASLDWAHTSLGRHNVELQWRGGESLAELRPFILDMLNQFPPLPQSLRQALLFLSLGRIKIYHRLLKHDLGVWARAVDALWLRSEISAHLLFFYLNYDSYLQSMGFWGVGGVWGVGGERGRRWATVGGVGGCG